VNSLRDIVARVVLQVVRTEAMRVISLINANSPKPVPLPRFTSLWFT
jgi:hypothetical protein